MITMIEFIIVITSITKITVQTVLTLPLVRDGEFMAAFGAAGCQDAATVLRRHTRTKTVFIGALAAAWLVGAFHESLVPVLSGAANRPRARFGSVSAKNSGPGRILCFH